MFRVFYAHLFEDEPDMQEAAEALSNKVYEFSEFLVNILGVTDMGSTNSGSHTFHTSCHLLRELSVKDPPHELLRNVSGIEVKDLPQSEVCCGFGGTFSVKYPHISEEMLSDKVQNIVSTEADTLVSCDMSCLMNIGGALSRTGSAIKTRHLAEVLDGERS
jgi:L-lactate dehydrogenase complex protein LldE